MNLDASELDVLDVATHWAQAEGLDTDEWEDDDFLEYFYNEVAWKNVVAVEWRSGRFAGVKTFGGVYLTYTDAETYGPFATLDEAEARLDLEGDAEGIAKYTRAPG